MIDNLCNKLGTREGHTLPSLTPGVDVGVMMLTPMLMLVTLV